LLGRSVNLRLYTLLGTPNSQVNCQSARRARPGRRAKRETGAAAAEAAHDAAIDHIAEVSQSILAAPGRSLARLALKAHVVKTWGKPEWWDAGEDRADTYERFAAQILDAVIRLAETGKLA